MTRFVQRNSIKLLSAHRCNWWWTPPPSRRQGRQGQSGRWRSGPVCWTRAWRGCCLQRSAPGSGSWPHRRPWRSACRCRWCLVWGWRRREEEESPRVRKQRSWSGGLREQMLTTECTADQKRPGLNTNGEMLNSLETCCGSIWHT